MIWSVCAWYVILAHEVACVNLELALLFRSRLSQQVASRACFCCKFTMQRVLCTVGVQILRSVTVVSSKVPPQAAGVSIFDDWVGGLRSASRGRWERVGLISDLIRRSLPRRMALGVVAV